MGRLNILMLRGETLNRKGLHDSIPYLPVDQLEYRICRQWRQQYAIAVMPRRHHQSMDWRRAQYRRVIAAGGAQSRP
jgi:hypothetical protein